MSLRVRFLRHALVLMSLLGAAWPAAAQPLVLEPLPLPGRFTELHQSSTGALLVSFGGWSEWGGARMSRLRLGRRWIEVPAGAAYDWGEWLVFEGLFPVPHFDDEGSRPASPWDGGTRTVSMGTDDSFVRRVVLVNAKTGRRVEAPWDTMAPLPLGAGDTWLVWRCAMRAMPDGGIEEGPAELLAWTPGPGRSVVVGILPGESRGSCHLRAAAPTLSVMTFPDGGFNHTSFAWTPAVLPRPDGALAFLVRDGGAEWVQLNARARVVRTGIDAGVHLALEPQDAGSPLEPFRELREAFRDQRQLTTVDGQVVSGRSADGGSTFPLSPSMGGGFAVFDGLVFADEGVFRWPPKAPALAPP